MSARRWWILALGLTGKLSPVYHVLDEQNRRTLCGIQLPEIYGKFVKTGQSGKEQAKMRCSECRKQVRAERWG